MRYYLSIIIIIIVTVLILDSVLLPFIDGLDDMACGSGYTVYRVMQACLKKNYLLVLRNITNFLSNYLSDSQLLLCSSESPSDIRVPGDVWLDRLPLLHEAQGQRLWEGDRITGHLVIF